MALASFDPFSRIVPLYKPHHFQLFYPELSNDPAVGWALTALAKRATSTNLTVHLIQQAIIAPRRKN